MECVRVILMTSFFSDEINLKMTANNDNRLRGSLPEIITKRIVGECSSSVTDSTPPPPPYNRSQKRIQPPAISQYITVCQYCVRHAVNLSVSLTKHLWFTSDDIS